MKLRLTDYKGEDITKEKFTPEFEKMINEARGMLFFVDDRYFPEFVENEARAGGAAAANPDNEWFQDPKELATWYTRILQRFLESSKGNAHIPIGLVVNKADLLLGADRFRSFEPPYLIPSKVRLDLVHAGVGAPPPDRFAREEAAKAGRADPAEPATAFDRLRHCIRYDLTNSRDLRSQRFILKFIEEFKSFIDTALAQTYRFQIFFTTSVVPHEQDKERFPYGVWESMRWLVSQLVDPYRRQVAQRIAEDTSRLTDLNRVLSNALSTYEAMLKKYEQSQDKLRRVVDARGNASVLSYLLPSRETAKERINHYETEMKNALEKALHEAKATPATIASPAPFVDEHSRVKQLQGRLEEQLKDLNGWYSALQNEGKSQ